MIVLKIFKYNPKIRDTNFKLFFLSLFYTTFLAYAPAIFTFLPMQVFGFNWTGVSWMLMLLMTINSLMHTKRITFPIWIWSPWILYMFLYLIYDFSILGLQLTLQYTLPILIGLVASSFRYSIVKLIWLFKLLLILVIIIIILFIIYKILYGFPAHMATTPMFLSIMASLLVGAFYQFNKLKYLGYFLILFLMPFTSMTRMGISVFLVILVFHFSNKTKISKILSSLLGIIILVYVLNSQSFKNKTFNNTSSTIKEISLNYYDNNNINSTGRKSFYIVLEKGLKSSLYFGNGPRSDIIFLKKITNEESGEAHNDYLSIRFNYGYVGLAFLLFGFIATFISVFRIKTYFDDRISQIIASSFLILLITFLMFMFSDNILKYTIFFPNYFFSLLGIIYSLYKKGGLPNKKLLLKNKISLAI